MRNQQRFGVLALAPEPWVGLSVGFDPKFAEAFKQLVQCRAWDLARKCWWFPHSYTSHVAQLVREHHLSSDAALDAARSQIEATLRQQRAKTDETREGDYAALGLHPTCPRVLVEWAIVYWRKEFSAYGAPTTRLLELEECYRRICEIPTPGEA